MDEIALVLDRSGSMGAYGVWPAVMESVPKFIDEQKNVEGRDARFTLAGFDYEYTLLYNGENIQLVNADTIFERFKPRGATALFDAIGQTIKTMGERLAGMPESERPENVIFAIYTDGQENCSSRYRLSDISEMIKHQEEKYNWKFVFLGAGIDAFAGAGAIGIRRTSTKGTRHDRVGTMGSTSGLGAYMNCIRSGGTEEQASKAFDVHYMAIVGEAPEQTDTTSSK